MRFHFLVTFVLVALISSTECNAGKILDSVVDGVASTIGSVARGVADTTGSVFGGIVDTSASVLDGIAHTTGTVIKGTIDSGSSVVRAISDTTKTAAGAISDTARTTWNAVRGCPDPGTDPSVSETKVFKSSSGDDVYAYLWTTRSRQGLPAREPSGESNNVNAVLVT